jgi:hypothetical protein
MICLIFGKVISPTIESIAPAAPGCRGFDEEVFRDGGICIREARIQVRRKIDASANAASAMIH